MHTPALALNQLSLKRSVLAFFAALTLWSGQARAAISLLDSDRLAIFYTANTSASFVSPPVKVSVGANLLVVVLSDKGASASGAAPASLMWGSQTLTRAVSTDNTASPWRNATVYFLYNPAPATSQSVTGTWAFTPTDYWVSIYTLSGVNTGFTPVTGTANSGSATSVSFTINSVPPGGWAATCANFANATGFASFGLTATSGSVITNVDGLDANTPVNMSCVSGLTAGANTFTVTEVGTIGAQKMAFAGAVFSPASSAPLSPANTLISASPTILLPNGMSTATIKVQAVDADGIYMNGSQGTVLLSTTLGTLSAVTDNNNGTYTATLTSATYPGMATISGTIAGAAIGHNASVWFNTKDNYRSLGYMYLSPVPEAEYTSPQTRFILVRFQNVSLATITNLSSFIQVSGAQSGIHAGQTKIASDSRTVIFSNSTDFAANELVTVNLSPGFNPVAGVAPYQYQFRISKPFTNFVASPTAPSPVTEPASLGPPPQSDPPPEMAGAPRPRILPNGISIPRDFPLIDIFTNNNPAPGYLFIDYDTPIDFTMILDNTGLPIWYKRGLGRDFKQQKNGLITMVGSPGFLGYDQNFNQVTSYRAVNGYSTDDHELQVRPDGHYFLFGLRTETVDMRRFVPTGRTNASVTETVLQEFTREGDLIFQYRSWDHYDIRFLEYWSYDDKPTSASIRFTHMNAVDVDYDGHLLLSNKRVSEVTKIDRDSGEVIWRLGGNHPDPAQDPYLGERLQILNDPLGQFNVQHDIRIVGTNRYSLFDNHWLYMTNAARAVDYTVNPSNRTATLVWQYQEMPPYGSYHMGSAQRLPNGNTLINWVIESAPKVTEVTPAGEKVFEMNWAARNSKSYRTFRFPWQGVCAAPYLIGELNPDNITLVFNKFGDSSVQKYRIYGGTNAAPTTLLAESSTTLARLYNLQQGKRHYFRVTAVDSVGNESPYSNEINLLANLYGPGENMVVNGDFSSDKTGWTLQVVSGAAATWSITNGTAFVDVVTPGSTLTNINLRRTGLNLVQGMDYVLTYDAWSSAPRTMEVKVRMDASPGTSYYTTTPSLTPVLKHFTNTFTMASASDPNGRIMFNMGVSAPDVSLDNISLVALAPGDFDRDRCIGFDDLKTFCNQWLQQGSVTADLNADSKVDFSDFTIIGENWPGGLACP